MILPDINLLIYAHNEAAPLHKLANRWWSSCLTGTVPIALPWIVTAGFIRLTTHPRVLVDPLKATEAVAYVEGWLNRPQVIVLDPGKRFQSYFFNYLKALGTGGNLTTDAYLAALAVEHQAELQSNDTDFHRFSGLRWTNPLQ